MIKTVIKIILMCCLVTLSFSQEIVVSPYGVSPREAVSDTLDIFDIAYNALPNVGIGTKLYLKTEFVDSTTTGFTWAVTTSPTNSTYTLGTAVAEGASIEFNTFTPDSTGTYVITVNEGATVGTITINAGTFLGIGTAGTSDTGCAGFCHGSKVDEWKLTGHSDMLVRAFDGTLSSHYGSYCVGCHVVGQDGADNDGFDDFDFVYPDSTALVDTYNSTDGHFYVGLYDDLAAAFPDAFRRANIQCESCHGPGSEHNGAPAVMSSSMDAQACAICHDSGSHHLRPAQWRASGHARPPYRTSGSCARCHTGGGFIQHVEDLAENPYPGGMATASCQACHDPHSVENTHQLRTLETTTLMNGVTITEGGTGKLCMNCHMTRRDANSYAEVGNTSSHFGPHYGVQADMLAATNAIMFGQQLPTSPHLTATENACVDCHMYNDNGHDDNNVPLEYGGHSFNMSDPITGREHVEACASCHGDVGTTFAEKLFFMNGFADHDGDGTVEGLQDEVHGLLDELAAALPHADSVAGYDPHDRPTLEWTRTEIKAAYNYDYVYYDHSYGIHNPAYTVALLKVSIQALLNNAVEGDIVAIEDVPNDQGYAVRIVWDKFVDDGVSLDPVEDYIVKRYDDFGDNPGFTTVGELLADGAPRYAMVVPTVFNLVGTDTAAALTEFIVVALHESGAVNASLPGEGFAIDNLVPAAPTNVLASAVDNYSVDLAWDASIDTDVNYYIVYRDGVEITTTADLTFTDSGLALGEYTYEITAVDFNGNEGDPSAGVSAEVLSVDPGSMPIEYTLAQNYPNPFNPVTTIKFSLPEAGLVNVTVFNSVGQVVSELVNKNMDIGYHSINFSADNLPSGVYFYTISSNSFTQTKKMILLK